MKKNSSDSENSGKRDRRRSACLFVLIAGLIAFTAGLYSAFSQTGFFTPSDSSDLLVLRVKRNAKRNKKAKKKPAPVKPHQKTSKKEPAVQIKRNKRAVESPLKPPPPPETPAKADETPKRTAKEYRGRAAIIIDDFGNSWKTVDDFSGLEIPVTFAVLPKLRYSGKTSWRARKSGKEVILHLPLENHEGKNPGPGTITTEMTADEVRKAFREDLETVPGAVGFNNHEGSKVTENRTSMKVIMEEAKEEDLFFIDSRTSVKTVGVESARKFGVPSASRKVFIDNEDDVDYICKQLEKLAERAADGGEVIGIGHCRKNTYLALKKMTPKFEEMGIRIVPVSELVKE